MLESNSEKIRGKQLQSVADYELEARRKLSPELVNYVFGSTESGATLARNLAGFTKYLLRRRVLQGIEDVKTQVSYFGGAITSDLPFFPAPINVDPIYPGALLDIIKVTKSFKIPVFLSNIPITPPLEVNKLPALAGPGASLIWQIYVFSDNQDLLLKQASLAEEWGYKALTITVDTERNVKLGDEIPPETEIHPFISLKPRDIKKFRKATSLPIVVKGIMDPDDAIIAVEAGADGVVVSNHGARTMDCGQATIEVLPEVVKKLRAKKSTRRTEIFFDGGIRRGTDILKALALGAGGCLLGRAIFWALAVDRERGVENVMTVLRRELVRTASLCAVSDLSKVKESVLRVA